MSHNLSFEPTKNPIYNFISYNREDADRVDKIAKLLPEAGINVWHDGGINPGDYWETIIAKRIRHCRAMILFFTKGILIKPDSFVKIEYEWARSLDPEKIIIVMMDKINTSDISDDKACWWIKINQVQYIKAYKKTPNEVAAELAGSLIKMASSTSCDIHNTENDTDETAKASYRNIHTDTNEVRLSKRTNSLSKIKGKAFLLSGLNIATILLIITIMKLQLGHSTIVQITTSTPPVRQSIMEDDSDSSAKSSSGIEEDDSGSMDSSESKSYVDSSQRDREQIDSQDDSQGGNKENDPQDGYKKTDPQNVSQGTGKQANPQGDNKQADPQNGSQGTGKQANPQGDNKQADPQNGSQSTGEQTNPQGDNKQTDPQDDSQGTGKQVNPQGDGKQTDSQNGSQVDKPATSDIDSDGHDDRAIADQEIITTEETTDSDPLVGNSENNESSHDNTQAGASVDSPAAQEDSTSNEVLIEDSDQATNDESSSDNMNPDNSDYESPNSSNAEEGDGASADNKVDDDSHISDFPSSDVKMKDYCGVNGADVKKLFTEAGLAVEFRTNDDQPIQPECNLDNAIICGQSVSIGQTIPSGDVPVVFWVTFPSDGTQAGTE